MLSLFSKLGFDVTGGKRDILRACVAMALAALLIGLTMSDAMRRGMHHRVMISSGEQTAIAIALSETVYKLKLGYVGHTSVLNAIQTHWNKGADGWSNLPQLIKNFGDREVLNAGIQAAANLGPQLSGYFTDGSLITAIYDDLGEVDFYKISFRIFGMKIESAFYLYFLLLGVSSIVFIVTFRRNVYALCVLLCTLFGFYQELNLAVFDLVASPTYFGMRHSSTLGVVPMWYLTFLLVFPRKASQTLVVGTVLQVAILILAWRIRASVTWVFLFLSFLAVVLTLARSRTAGLNGVWSWLYPIRSWSAWARTWPMLLKDALRWPVMLLLCGMLGNAIYNQQSRHLIYSTDDVIPYHGLWWAGVNALYFDKPQLFGERVKNTEGTPEGWWHLRDYYDRVRLVPWDGTYVMTNHPPGILSPWTGGQLKYRLVDETMKRIYVEAATKKPLASAQYYLIQQPIYLTQQLLVPFKQATGSAWLWLTFLASATIFAFARLFEDKTSSVPPDKIILLSVGAFLVSWLPGLWAHAVIAYFPDSINLAVCSMSLVLGLGAYRLYRFGRPAWVQ